MINQMTVRMWGGVLAMLTPGCLVDRLLDWLEKHGASEPAEADRAAREELHFEALLD